MEQNTEIVQPLTAMITEKTPDIISKPILAVISILEHFRIEYFNHPYIFYPLFLVLMFFLAKKLFNIIF